MSSSSSSTLSTTTAATISSSSSSSSSSATTTTTTTQSTAQRSFALGEMKPPVEIEFTVSSNIDVAKAQQKLLDKVVEIYNLIHSKLDQQEALSAAAREAYLNDLTTMRTKLLTTEKNKAAISTEAKDAVLVDDEYEKRIRHPDADLRGQITAILTDFLAYFLGDVKRALCALAKIDAKQGSTIIDLGINRTTQEIYARIAGFASKIQACEIGQRKYQELLLPNFKAPEPQMRMAPIALKGVTKIIIEISPGHSGPMGLRGLPGKAVDPGELKRIVNNLIQEFGEQLRTELFTYLDARLPALKSQFTSAAKKADEQARAKELEKLQENLLNIVTTKVAELSKAVHGELPSLMATECTKVLTKLVPETLREFIERIEKLETELNKSSDNLAADAVKKLIAEAINEVVVKITAQVTKNINADLLTLTERVAKLEAENAALKTELKNQATVTPQYATTLAQHTDRLQNQANLLVLLQLEKELLARQLKAEQQKLKQTGLEEARRFVVTLTHLVETLKKQYWEEVVNSSTRVGSSWASALGTVASLILFFQWIYPNMPNMHAIDTIREEQKKVPSNVGQALLALVDAAIYFAEWAAIGIVTEKGLRDVIFSVWNGMLHPWGTLTEAKRQAQAYITALRAQIRLLEESGSAELWRNVVAFLSSNDAIMIEKDLLKDLLVLIMHLTPNGHRYRNELRSAITLGLADTLETMSPNGRNERVRWLLQEVTESKLADLQPSMSDIRRDLYGLFISALFVVQLRLQVAEHERVLKATLQAIVANQAAPAPAAPLVQVAIAGMLLGEQTDGLPLTQALKYLADLNHAVTSNQIVYPQIPDVGNNLGQLTANERTPLVELMSRDYLENIINFVYEDRRYFRDGRPDNLIVGFALVRQQLLQLAAKGNERLFKRVIGDYLSALYRDTVERQRHFEHVVMRLVAASADFRSDVDLLPTVLGGGRAAALQQVHNNILQWLIDIYPGLLMQGLPLNGANSIYHGALQVLHASGLRSHQSYAAARAILGFPDVTVIESNAQLISDSYIQIDLKRCYNQAVARQAADAKAVVDNIPVPTKDDGKFCARAIQFRSEVATQIQAAHVRLLERTQKEIADRIVSHCQTWSTNRQGQRGYNPSNNETRAFIEYIQKNLQQRDAVVVKPVCPQDIMQDIFSRQLDYKSITNEFKQAITKQSSELMHETTSIISTAQLALLKQYQDLYLAQRGIIIESVLKTLHNEKLPAIMRVSGAIDQAAWEKFVGDSSIDYSHHTRIFGVLQSRYQAQLRQLTTAIQESTQLEIVNVFDAKTCTISDLPNSFNQLLADWFSKGGGDEDFVIPLAEIISNVADKVYAALTNNNQFPSESWLKQQYLAIVLELQHQDEIAAKARNGNSDSMDIGRLHPGGYIRVSGDDSTNSGIRSPSYGSVASGVSDDAFRKEDIFGSQSSIGIAPKHIADANSSSSAASSSSGNFFNMPFYAKGGRSLSVFNSNSSSTIVTSSSSSSSTANLANRFRKVGNTLGVNRGDYDSIPSLADDGTPVSRINS